MESHFFSYHDMIVLKTLNNTMKCIHALMSVAAFIILIQWIIGQTVMQLCGPQEDLPITMRNMPDFLVIGSIHYRSNWNQLSDTPSASLAFFPYLYSFVEV
mgnify:CR=1 FL=1